MDCRSQTVALDVKDAKIGNEPEGPGESMASVYCDTNILGESMTSVYNLSPFVLVILIYIRNYLFCSYGHPVSAAEAALLVPPGSEGLIWHANLVADNYSHAKHTSAPGGSSYTPTPHMCRAFDLTHLSGPRNYFHSTLTFYQILPTPIDPSRE